MNKSQILASFDKKFPSLQQVFRQNGRPVTEDLESFLSTSIDSLLKSVEEKCEEMNKPNGKIGGFNVVYSEYNKALNDLKSSIKSLYE